MRIHPDGRGACNEPYEKFKLAFSFQASSRTAVTHRPLKIFLVSSNDTTLSSNVKKFFMPAGGADQ